MIFPQEMSFSVTVRCGVWEKMSLTTSCRLDPLPSSIITARKMSLLILVGSGNPEQVRFDTAQNHSWPNVPY